MKEPRNRWWKNLRYPHIQLPKELFEERYRHVDLGAKVLYAMMLDRMKLSDKNGWIDDEGSIYIYFTLDDIMERMSISRSTAAKYKKELIDAHLIRFSRKGKTDPHRIYVLPFFAAQNTESENQTSCGTENKPHEVQNPDPSNTNDNNTGGNDIYPSRMDGYSFGTVEKLIKNNIEYDVLSERGYDMDLIGGYVDIMTRAVCSRQEYISIGSDKIPAELVRSRFLKYNMSHVLYVYRCMEGNTTSIRNIRAYLLKALYDAPATMGSHYQAMMLHDMPQLAKGPGREAAG